MGTIFCVADCHLGRRLRNRRMFANDSYDVFTEMCDKIIKDSSEEKALILAGDTTDKNYVDGKSLEVIADNIDRLYEEGITTYSIMGNHDYDDKSILSTQGAEDINEKLVDICGYKVYGLDYRPPEILRDDLQHVPECDLLILHQAFQHLMGFEGAYDVSVHSLPDYVKNTFCGDIHVTDIKELEDDRLFISPGSLHPVKVDEGNKHGFMKFDGEWEFVPVTTRQILRDELHNEEEFKAFDESVKKLKMDPAPVIEVKYEKSLSGKVEEIRKEYEDKSCFITTSFTEMDMETEEPSSSSLTSTMKDKLEEAVDKEKNSEQFRFCERLLDEPFDRVAEDKLREYEIELEEN